MKKFLECGKIVSTHGIVGELKVQPWCDSPDFMCEFGQFYLNNGESVLPVEHCRVHKNMVLLKLVGINSVEQAVTLRGKILYIDRADAPEDDSDGYFVQDLIGLCVLDVDTGESYGTLTDVWQTGANDVYEITDSAKVKRLIPAIKDVVITTDITAGQMLIRPLEGLFDNED